VGSETIVTDDARRATLSRIAREASVSMSTVSKVLNGRPGVSGATRARVEELLLRHAYNRRGGGDNSSAAFIELVINSLESEWALELIRGVDRAARANGLSVVLTRSSNRHTLDAGWIEGVIRRRPVGVVMILADLSAEHKKQLRTRNIPFVLVDPTGDPAPDVPSIGSANWSGGLAATRHLIDLGHRRIAIITGPADMMCSHARVSGFRSAMSAAGIPVREEYVIGGEFRRDIGLEAATRLMALAEPPTAIFASSDMQALGVYEAARTLGLRIPDDLSVVGYDDLPVAQWLGPPLTTVRQPLVEMAEEATQLAIRLRSGAEEQRNLRVDLATRLIERDSARPPQK
jgi:LacI family xylobiose transport system transcriptional regulator